MDIDTEAGTGASTDVVIEFPDVIGGSGVRKASLWKPLDPITPKERKKTHKAHKIFYMSV